jgi:hypothetical protein
LRIAGRFHTGTERAALEAPFLLPGSGRLYPAAEIFPQDCS